MLYAITKKSYIKNKVNINICKPKYTNSAQTQLMEMQKEMEGAVTVERSALETGV